MTRTEDAPLTPPQGASVFEEDLFGYLVRHGEHEGKLLAEYQRAASETDSAALAYVIGLLCEDEHRHHDFFRALADSLRAEIECRDPEIPYLDFDRADTEKVRDVTRRLLRSERDDARELKRLTKILHTVKDPSLWDLLIDVIRLDTEKHMAMLKFVLAHTKSGR